jgi:rod shape-determining protein MreD
MIMRPGQAMLLPASVPFIWWSLVLAFLLNVLLSLSLESGGQWLPDVLAMTLVFWNLNQTRRVGLSAAFAFGLMMDVHQSALLGQHALAYTVMAYFAVMLHRRLAFFSPMEQALQLAPLFWGTHALQWAVRWMADDSAPQWPALIAPVGDMLLWPLLAYLLLAPQRRVPDPDETRAL